jgi:DNA-binding transcriptional regulator YdaS (Cro superfamily)
MTTRDIITALGGPAAVGRALGIRTQAVSRWLRKGRVPLERVPALLALAAQRGLALTARQVREDFDWAGCV